MKIAVSILTAALFAVPATFAQLQPVVSNVQAAQRPGTKLVDITYDLAFGGGTTTVWMEVSNDGGRSYIVPAKTFSGHIGQGVAPGAGKAVVWNAEADFDGMLAEQMRVRVSARSGTVPVPPPNMVFIPGGHFYMGEWAGDAGAGAARSVYISPMFMDRYEVWGSLYGQVRDWGIQNGYSISAGGARAGDHPIHSLNWVEVVKWCNARSEREGLVPVYYTDTAQTIVYRSGSVNLDNSMVKWSANGYRLPTEAEWEKAARGALSGKLYPWGDQIDATMANYLGVSHPWSNVDPKTTPVGYYNGFQQGGGDDMTNGYGIYDMAGNVAERVWDKSPRLDSGNVDPIGTNSGTERLICGGRWTDTGDRNYVTRRGTSSHTSSNAYYWVVPDLGGGGTGGSISTSIGFRTVRRF